MSENHFMRSIFTIFHILKTITINVLLGIRWLFTFMKYSLRFLLVSFNESYANSVLVSFNESYTNSVLVSFNESYTNSEIVSLTSPTLTRE